MLIILFLKLCTQYIKNLQYRLQTKIYKNQYNTYSYARKNIKHYKWDINCKQYLFTTYRTRKD